MGAIYLGILTREGYLFATNDVFGDAHHECAIVRINSQCGALIVTARGNFLGRVKKILDQHLIRLSSELPGLTESLVKAIVAAMKTTFRKDQSYKRKPLPFLLLMVGKRYGYPISIDHVFIRNRVVERMEKKHGKEYVTKFDIQQAIPAENLFYGNSELAQLLFQNLFSDTLNLEEAKIMAYLAISETQRIDHTIFPNIRMACLSVTEEFNWIQENEVAKIANLSKRINEDFTGKLRSLFNSSFNDFEILKMMGSA